MKPKYFYTLSMAMCIFGSAVFAGPKTKISVLFQDFPKGTECNVSGAVGKVKLKKKRGHPKVDIKGYAEKGTIYCVLPDGRKVVTDVNKKLMKDARVAGVTILPNGEGHITTSAVSGLFQEQISGALKSVK